MMAKTFLWLKAVVMIPSLMNVSYDLMSVISGTKANKTIQIVINIYV